MTTSLGWAERLMQWLAFGMRLVLINVLFLAGTIAGLGVLGLFPAAAAASALLARLRAGTAEDRLVRDFVAVYRRQFVHMNRVGSIFWAAAVLAVLNILSFSTPGISPLSGPSPAGAVLFSLFAAVCLIALAAAFTAVSICVRYRDTVLRTWRLALVLPIASPVAGLGVLLTLAAAGSVFTAVPVLIPLAGASLPLLLTGWLLDRRLGELAVVPAPAPAPAPDMKGSHAASAA
ncbi:YesL family protein [Arthrobacter sp. G119Y2]|uniref:YesL family protein n=1 Tax=Arthrobacter sp. G119Y2 TaxID=3134965 RepID=UPI003119EF96